MITVPEWPAYTSSKGAIEILIRYLAKELDERQIQENVVAPDVI
ncbi:MAG: SDR family oxidoreductase [Leptolyngbyaceae cyanobacterium]